MKALVQLERITFRAVLVFLGTALFVCSESDIFLMNFNTKYKWCVERKYIVLNFHTFLPGTGTGCFYLSGFDGSSIYSRL